MWTFEPKIPFGLWWALVAVAIAAMVVYAYRGASGLAGSRRLLLTALLGLGLIGPLWVALNPIWVEPVPPPSEAPRLDVLVDGTLSMTVSDSSTGPQRTRWQTALDLAGQVGSTSDVQVRRWTFDSKLHPWEAPPGASWSLVQSHAPTPQGHQSDLAAAMRQAVRSGTSSGSGQAILLISDGAHNVGPSSAAVAAAREANSLDVPIYTVTVGAEVGATNLAIASRSPRMIAFRDNPLVITVRLEHSGLAGQTTQVSLVQDDRVVQSRHVSLTSDPVVELAFTLPQLPDQSVQRYRVLVEPIEGEATEADNETSVLVQRLDHPIGVLLLEGKPYWDSKFLVRNLGGDTNVELSTVVQVGAGRFLTQKHHRATPTSVRPTSNESVPAVDSAAEADADSSGSADESSSNDVTSADDPAARPSWEIRTDFGSPLEDPTALADYRLIILGRDADVYLTSTGVENLRQWISRSGGCLLCARGAPTSEVMTRLAEILPVRWATASESRFRTRISDYGYDAAVFESLTSPESSSGDPLPALPSLSTDAVPSARAGLPQVLVHSDPDSQGGTIPVVTYQPFGRGQTIVVEGAGMWRWAFLPPQHAARDTVYPALWQSMIQWVISQQDLLPGRDVAIRSDRGSFLTGENATATVLVESARKYRTTDGVLDLNVLIEGPGLQVAQRRPLVPSGLDENLFAVDFGPLSVGHYTARVVTGAQDTAVAETVLEIRDPWFEQLALDARPDLMRRVAQASGGTVLSADQVGGVVERFRQRLDERRPPQEIRTTMWDRPVVLITTMSAWLTAWIVRRRMGVV